MATLTIHHRWCSAGFEGPDYFAACHQTTLPESRLAVSGSTDREGRTGADGNLTFASLPPGAYEVSGGGGPTDFVDLAVFCALAAAPGSEFPSTTEQLPGGPGAFLVELNLSAGDHVICDFYVIPADLGLPDDGTPAAPTDSRPGTTDPAATPPRSTTLPNTGTGHATPGAGQLSLGMAVLTLSATTTAILRGIARRSRATPTA
ncbi:MAG: hypothetical protein M3464_04595 [Chloroflexota bacterium]|nr:hypothetical protein [Chloroflexota bacterium]